MKKHALFAALSAALTLTTVPVNADVMVGAFVPGNAWNQQAITDLNQNLPKSTAFINVFSSFSESWDHLFWQSSKIVNEGMTPMISWMPIEYSRYNTNLLPEIVLGQWDSYIDLWGTKLAAWVNMYPADDRPTVLLRFGHEFNGTWYSYGDSPTWYKAAWQHIHDRFEAAGINENIEWVWSANNVNVDSYNDMTQYYPGDTYVDWTSIDGYNWGSNFSWSSWDSFSDVFAPAYATLVTNYPDKPILIGEVGSADPADTPDASWGQNGDNSDYLENKDTWTADMMTAIENEFPAIRALALFNINKELDWSLTEYASTGLQGFTGGLQSPHFTSDYLTAASDDISFLTPLDSQALDGASQTFSWTEPRESWIYAGSSEGGRQYADSGVVGVTNSITVSGLPTDGSTVHIRLWFRDTAGIGDWEFSDHSFTASSYSAAADTTQASAITTVASVVTTTPAVQPSVSPQGNDLQWAHDLLAQVTVAPDSLIIGAARKSASEVDSIKVDVEELTRERTVIATLEAEIKALEKNGSAKKLRKAVSDLEKTQARFEARQDRLLKKQAQVRSQLDNRSNRKSVKKIKKSDQRLRAMSKPLPAVNISKRDKMRNGFKSMSAEQKALFNASKRSIIE